MLSEKPLDSVQAQSPELQCRSHEPQKATTYPPGSSFLRDQGRGEQVKLGQKSSALHMIMSENHKDQEDRYLTTWSAFLCWELPREQTPKHNQPRAITDSGGLRRGVSQKRLISFSTSALQVVLTWGSSRVVTAIVIRLYAGGAGVELIAWEFSDLGCGISG